MYKELVNYIGTKSGVVLGFSGGVDSSLLALALRDSGIDYLAVTVHSCLHTEEEIAQSSSFCTQHSIHHRIVPMDVLAVERIADNPKDRCYHCKVRVFGKLKEIATELGYEAVFDGSHLDDLSRYRPGRKALLELGIESPFVELGWNKSDIRQVRRKQGLPEQESAPCLATRFPYGDALTEKKLRQVERAEALLRKAGLHALRCRVHGDLLRVEAVDVQKAFQIVSEQKEALQKLGYSFVTVDVFGYRTGCYDG